LIDFRNQKDINKFYGIDPSVEYIEAKYSQNVSGLSTSVGNKIFNTLQGSVAGEIIKRETSGQGGRPLKIRKDNFLNQLLIVRGRNFQAQGLSTDQIEQLKKQNFGDRADWYKALWVNRNATRKMPGDVLYSWKLFLDELEQKHGHRNAMLIMHTDPKDPEGPDLLAVAAELKLQNHVWFSTDKLDYGHMNVLHNLVDTVVNISRNEGWGLSTHISMQVGKPIIALTTGGETFQVIDELDGSEHGVALKPCKRSLVGSQMVPFIFEDFPSTEETVQAFMKIYEMTDEEKDAMREKTVKFVDRELNYENVIKKWDETLEKCILDFKEKKSKNEGNYKLTDIDAILEATYQLNKNISGK
jgi:glycosyltransferase involved in cell wall biosynthesis